MNIKVIASLLSGLLVLYYVFFTGTPEPASITEYKPPEIVLAPSAINSSNDEYKEKMLAAHPRKEIPTAEDQEGADPGEIEADNIVFSHTGDNTQVVSDSSFSGFPPAVGSPPIEDTYFDESGDAEPETVNDERFAVLNEFRFSPEMHGVSVDVLKSMVAEGDRSATEYLGQKYLYEINQKKDHPDYEEGVDYLAESRSLFLKALILGDKHAASSMGESYLKEDKILEADAWFLIAEKLGDIATVEWYRSSELYKNLTESDKNVTHEKSVAYMENIDKKRNQAGFTSFFGGV